MPQHQCFQAEACVMGDYSGEGKEFSKGKPLGYVPQEAFKHTNKHHKVRHLYLTVEC